MDWAVETESECGSLAALGVSGTVFGPVAQDEGRGGCIGPVAGPRLFGGVGTRARLVFLNSSCAGWCVSVWCVGVLTCGVGWA